MQRVPTKAKMLPTLEYLPYDSLHVASLPFFISLSRRCPDPRPYNERRRLLRSTSSVAKRTGTTTTPYAGDYCAARSLLSRTPQRESARGASCTSCTIESKDLREEATKTTNNVRNLMTDASEANQARMRCVVA